MYRELTPFEQAQEAASANRRFIDDPANKTVQEQFQEALKLRRFCLDAAIDEILENIDAGRFLGESEAMTRFLISIQGLIQKGDALVVKIIEARIRLEMGMERIQEIKARIA